MMPAEEIAPASMMQKWLVFNLLLRCICCIHSRCHSFCMLHFIPLQKLRQRFSTAAIAATYMWPRRGRDYCNVEIADSRPLQRSTFRIACALWLPRWLCGWGLSRGITAMLFAPPRPKVLKNLKDVKLGQKQTCGTLCVENFTAAFVVLVIFFLSLSPWRESATYLLRTTSGMPTAT